MEMPGSQDADKSWIQLISAMLYVIGITLGAVGCVGAFLWPSLLWSTLGGLVVIAVSLTISDGRP